jgi:tetratricopeptide (TPR) repeat protein
MAWWQKLTGKARGVFGAPSSKEECDHSTISLRQGTAEFEWFVARAELESGNNLQHGAKHLANLLSYDPGRLEWIDLLKDYLRAAGPDPEALIPREEKPYCSTEAMRAYIYHEQGRLMEAVDLLTQAVKAKPEARYLEAWALDWLEPAGAVEALPQTTAIRLFMLVLGHYPEASQLTWLRQREIDRFAQLLERYVAQLPADDMMIMLRAGLHRKAGNFNHAEAVARAAMAHSPSWHAASALGLVLRKKGDLADAEKAFELGLRLDANDISARLEAGDMFYDYEQWQPALKWYENALAKDPNQAWAKPSALFCRWKLTDDKRLLDDLVSLAKQCPDNRRAQQLCQEAYGGVLPEPVDATANLLRQIPDMVRKNPASFATGSELTINISSLEAPSNYLAFRLEMAALNRAPHLKVNVKNPTNPDPREPIASVRFLLWKYDGTDAAPGLPPAGKEVAERIADIAKKRCDLLAYWAPASRLGHDVGPERVGQLLAVMVNPPSLPSGMSILSWLPRVQFVAAAAAAQIEEGWENSSRREALYSALHGPMDWTTEAAIRALTQLCLENPAFALDIHDAFQLLADHQPDRGHWGWVRLLYSCWLQLPHLFPPERDKMRQILHEMDVKAEEEASERKSPSPRQ